MMLTLEPPKQLPLLTRTQVESRLVNTLVEFTALLTNNFVGDSGATGIGPDSLKPREQTLGVSERREGREVASLKIKLEEIKI